VLTGLSLYSILLLGLLLVILITHFIVRIIEKAFSKKVGFWVYLLISIFPLKEIMHLWFDELIKLSNPFFWFWFSFWLSCVLLFWHSRSKWIKVKKNEMV